MASDPGSAAAPGEQAEGIMSTILTQALQPGALVREKSGSLRVTVCHLPEGDGDLAEGASGCLSEMRPPNSEHR